MYKTGHNLHKFAPQCTIFWGGTETKKNWQKSFPQEISPLKACLTNLAIILKKKHSWNTSFD